MRPKQYPIRRGGGDHIRVIVVFRRGLVCPRPRCYCRGSYVALDQTIGGCRVHDYLLSEAASDVTSAKTLARTRLLILDGWAMVKLTADQRRDLMEVIDDRHDRGSTIVATQIPQDSWHLQIGDPTYADAILDRLVNNAYRLELKGKSMRGNGARRAVADPAMDKIGAK